MALSHDDQQLRAAWEKKWPVHDWETAHPLPQHQVLSQDEGVWDSTVQVFVGGPNRPPMTFTGVETYTVLKQGLWTIAEIQGDHQIVAIYGYDSYHNKFVGSWIESTSPYRVQLEGEYDEASRTLTMIAKGTDPHSGQVLNERQVITHTDDDTRVLSQYRLKDDGTQFKVLEATAKRRKPQA